MTDRPVTVWRSSRLYGRWQLQLEDLARRFGGSAWAELEWPLPRSVRGFITAPDGLSSVVDDEDDFYAIEADCRHARCEALR